MIEGIIEEMVNAPPTTSTCMDLLQSDFFANGEARDEGVYEGKEEEEEGSGTENEGAREEEGPEEREEAEEEEGSRSRELIRRGSGSGSGIRKNYLEGRSGTGIIYDNSVHEDSEQMTKEKAEKGGVVILERGIGLEIEEKENRNVNECRDSAISVETCKKREEMKQEVEEVGEVEEVQRRKLKERIEQQEEELEQQVMGNEAEEDQKEEQKERKREDDRKVKEGREENPTAEHNRVQCKSLACLLRRRWESNYRLHCVGLNWERFSLSALAQVAVGLGGKRFAIVSVSS